MTTCIGWLTARLRSVLSQDRRDRGEVVPTAIIWAIAGVIAVAVVLAASDYVTSWIDLWPEPIAP